MGIEKKETRQRVVFTLPRHLRQGRKPLGDIREKRNEAACGIHAASSPQESPRGGVRKKRDEAACGIHTASLCTLQERATTKG
jgi:hypothetical protein